MKQIFNSRVVYKKYLTEDLLLIGFSANIDFKAGQFFHIILDKDDPDNEKTGFRPYSILNSPKDAHSRGIIESFIRLIPNGLASEYLRKLNVSDEVLLRGPFGKFILDKNNNKHVLFCTGTGITPIHSIIQQHIESENEFTLFHGAKNKEELLYYDKFKEFEKKYKNFKYIASLTREHEWDGLKGRLTQHLNIIDTFSDKTVYICGVKEFISDVITILKDKTKNIIMERYT
ncbi:MAG: phenol hydroxylase [Candidatus Woesearchaeota archaeon]|nr:MAG: phenol hydroxylase [Candidatus Woesearchaeota archaeon]